jgi:HlyD family secretion protein
VLDVPGGLVQIATPRDGIVSAVLVEDGARVAAGTVLARIDDRLERAQLAVAEAELAERTASLRVLEAKLAGARREHDRLTAAVKVDAVDRRSLDTATTDVNVLEAEIRNRQAERAVVEARRDAVRQEVVVREIRAPSDGVVVRRQARPGDGVSVFQVSTMFWFAPDTARIARIEIDEAHAAALRAGQVAEVSLELVDAGPRTWTARVDKIGAAFAPRRVQVYDPRERSDVRVLEVTLAFAGEAPPVPLGTRLVARIAPAALPR